MSSSDKTLPHPEGGGGRAVYCCLLWRIRATIRNRFEVKMTRMGICECQLREEMVMVFDNKNVV